MGIRHGNNNEEIDTDESESDRNVCDDEESNNEGIDKIERVGQCSFWDKTQKTMKSPDINADDWVTSAFSRKWYPGQFRHLRGIRKLL